MAGKRVGGLQRKLSQKVAGGAADVDGFAIVAPRRRYRVELLHVPAMVIGDCASADEAFSRYLAVNGIIASDHRPEIGEVEEEVVVPGPVVTEDR